MPKSFRDYTRETEPKDTITGCLARFDDVADCTNNLKQSYETLRLDYDGNPFQAEIKTGGEMYVMRFTSDDGPSNKEYPKTDGSEPENLPPCTGTGFTGSEHHLVPEYRHGKTPITNGAIFLVKDNGEEYLAAIWNGDNFEKA